MSSGPPAPVALVPTGETVGWFDPARDVWVGINRFERIRADLGISTKVLSERLQSLVDHGVLDQRKYQDRPTRYEYVLTDKGIELCDVLMVLARWGDRWTAGESGPPVWLRHRGCGSITHAEVRCAVCHELPSAGDVDHEPGPGSGSSEGQLVPR